MVLCIQSLDIRIFQFPGRVALSRFSEVAPQRPFLHWGVHRAICKVEILLLGVGPRHEKRCLSFNKHQGMNGDQQIGGTSRTNVVTGFFHSPNHSAKFFWTMPVCIFIVLWFWSSQCNHISCACRPAYPPCTFSPVRILKLGAEDFQFLGVEGMNHPETRSWRASWTPWISGSEQNFWLQWCQASQFEYLFLLKLANSYHCFPFWWLFSCLVTGVVAEVVTTCCYFCRCYRCFSCCSCHGHTIVDYVSAQQNYMNCRCVFHHCAGRRPVVGRAFCRS